MILEIRPILASFRAHRVPALLIVLEIALACAVLCNAVFMISQHVTEIRLPNAIDEQGITVLGISGIDPQRAAVDVPADLAALRRIAGVRAVGSASSMPLDGQGQGWAFGSAPETDVAGAAAVTMDYTFLGDGAGRALGLQLQQGRFFNDDEYANSALGPELMPTTHVVVITRSLAQRLWPGQAPLGKLMYSRPLWYTVIGVVADVLSPDDDSPGPNNQRGFYYSAFFPVNPASSVTAFGPAIIQTDYVLRSVPADRDRILREAGQALRRLHPSAVVQARRFTDIRKQYFADTSNMVWTLVVICGVMLVVTAFGIVGLTSFWVRQRRRQIGIRRALGASRGHILRYFQLENFLLSSVGVGIGMVLAFGVNLYQMRHYEMQLMPWYYLPSSAAALWLIGQIAVLGPAWRASQVPPVVATRSV